jgi:moderate conductance mechanosensitive channel
MPLQDSSPDTVGAVSQGLASLGEADNATELLVAMRDILLNPILWMDVASVILRVLIIIVFTFAVIRLIDRTTETFTRRVKDLPHIHPKKQRALTISNLISSTARYFLWPVAAIMSLSAFAIDVGALIATAGIAGLAIGFGAQTLVKDVIGGIFLLIDDTIHVGDSIKIGGDIGMVEQIGVRMIRVRKFDGEVLMVPAGELRIFGNRSIGFARVIVNIGLSYEQDIETILPVMERVANEWAVGKEEILKEEKPTVQAITDFAESSINARIVVQVTPGEQHAAERELRLLLKREFDRLGIEIPFPRQTVYFRREDELPPRSIREEAPAGHDDVAGSD